MENKEQIRERMKRLRRQLTREMILENSRRITERITGAPFYRDSSFLCIYLSAFREPDTSFLISRAFADGKRVCVPITDRANHSLSLSEILPGDGFVKGAYGIREPERLRPVPADVWELAVIPGLAFSAVGGRVGFGEGYYDRLLAGSGGVKAGICHGFQLLKEITTQPHDAVMDWIITEGTVIDCGKNKTI